MKRLYYFIILFLVTGFHAFPEGINNKAVEYVPAFFLKGTGKKHEIFYYDPDQRKMLFFKTLDYNMNDSRCHIISISPKGKRVIIHQVIKKRVVNSEGERLLSCFVINNMETGEKNHNYLPADTFNAGSGIFSRGYYIFPVSKLHLLERALKNNGKNAEEQLKAMLSNADISEVEKLIDNMSLVSQDTMLCLYDLSSGDKVIQQLPVENSRAVPEIGNYMVRDDENMIYISLYHDVYILDVEERKWVNNETAKCNDNLFYTSDEVFKNPYSENKLVWETNHTIMSIGPLDRCVLYYNRTDRANVYLRNLETDEEMKIHTVCDKRYRELPNKNYYPDQYLHQFIGWVNKESIK